MKKTVKFFVTMALAAVTLFTMTPYSVYAGHKTGCSSILYRVECGSPIAATGYNNHILYNNVNGQVTCSYFYNNKYHNLYCSACNGDLKTNDRRTCEEIHQYCPNKTGICQY